MLARLKGSIKLLFLKVNVYSTVADSLRNALIWVKYI
jgi:hypothetical protein